MDELPIRYNPQDTEDRLYRSWEEQGSFHVTCDPAKKPFSIVIPPPNVTGILHMGHALNNTIQDILIRYHRMLGQAALWMPGTDHAGIATQNVVERAIAKEGLKRQDLGRDKFIQRVWVWKEQYGSTIIKQLKKLGASCDWTRERFTMDEDYSKSVTEVFVRLYESGLIYRGSYIINWCPRCQTALSDEEAPHRDLQGNLYYLKYPLKDNPDEFVVVATTRPETMLGDTAVAVNPKDKRYKKLVGKTLILPLVDREIKIIADSMVDSEFGTGAVKVTPAHDPNDYALGKKHKLDFINVLHPDARMNEAAGDYSGMDRFEAREVILEDLKEKNLLEKIEPHPLSAGHCYRCHTIIEPYLSKQWFVKMKPLAKPAIEAVKKGKIKFHPARWTKVYLNWMENIQDWCVSRQIWWGHRLPVYYCRECLKKAEGVIVSRVKPDICPACGSTDIYQDEDVLDTWFSSWLWPFATFGWPFSSSVVRSPSSETAYERRTTPRLRSGQANDERPEKDLEYFYPTSVLVTAPEIIFFWVARMIMAGYKFMGEKPFSDVYIHGTVRDIEGKKMSKSLGNVIDPLEIIKEYGADALRFSLISTTAQGQDVFLSKERFEQGRNFANKLWNASRFILMNLDREHVKADLCAAFISQDFNLIDRWILSRFYATLKEANKDLDNFKFNEAANLLYSFFWHEFCDWYLEMIKSDIKNPQHELVMYKILEKFIRVLHSFMPFITEEVWQRIINPGTSIMQQSWPHLQANMIDKKVDARMDFIFAAVTAVRNMRADLEIPLRDLIDVYIACSDPAKRAVLVELLPQAQSLCKANIAVEQHYSKKPGEFVAVVEDAHVVIKLAGVGDIEKHKAKIMEKIARAKAQIASKKNTLANAAFIKNAPPDIVEAEKTKLKELEETLKKLEGLRDDFGQ
ncbi:MAG: valine--tRNA ligase [Candidatus Omnitrophota bacterium]|nr:valine--tRNA ligase [Candidatus Omnitrophota bacterium]